MDISATKKEADRILKMSRDTNYMGYSFASEAEKMAIAVTDLLAEVERLQSGWVSVAERLPDNPKEVEIAFWDGCYMQRVFGGFVDGAWYVGSEMLEEDSLKVTHWKKPMPLPSPPELTLEDEG